MTLSFSQTDNQFEQVKKAALDALKVIFPVEGKLRKVVLESAWVDDSLDATDYASQTKARNSENTWGVSVYAHLKLLDAAGHVIDENPKVRLFTLPKPTQRHSYIVGGNEYQVHNQLRLKSGVYTLRKQNGELKTQVNLSKGKNFDLGFDENKGLFTIQGVGGGQANITLYPILLYLGIPRSDIAKAWGDKLAAQNAEKSDPRSVQRLEAAFGVKKGQILNDYLANTKLDGDTTKLVLGKAFDKVDGQMLLSASTNLLKVHLGKEEPTDRDSLEFKELHGIDDFIRERLEKNQQALAFKIKRNIDSPKRVKISQIVNGSSFSSTIESFFTQDDKSSTPEQTNTLEMLSGTQKVTIMGAGGISTTHAVTPEMRQIHPSHFGLIDPVHTPECYDERTEVFTAEGWKKWPEVDLNTLLACREDGKLTFNKPEKLHQSFYKGTMYGVENGKLDFLVTPNHRMFVRPLDSARDAWRIESAESTHNKPRTFCVTHAPYEGESSTYFKLEQVKGGNATKNHASTSVHINDWCEFMGWFLSEGCAAYNEENSSYLVRIAQDKKANPEKCKRIEGLLSRLPWNWNQNGDEDSYGTWSKQLAWHLKDQGNCDKKFIPEYLFDTPVEARKLLMQSLLDGDGRTRSNRKNGVSYKQSVFCTTSKKLSEGFERLAIGLGYSTTVHVYEDKREERYLDTYEVRILQREVRSARKSNTRRKKSDYYTTDYEGVVYCATVPGSLLLVKRGDGIPVWLGNSDRIGANLHLPLGAVKDGKQLKMQVVDDSGKTVLLGPTESRNKKIMLPGQDDKGNGLVKVFYKGQVTEMPRDKVDYKIPSPNSLFSWSTNLIPFLPSAQGNRAMMAAKMMEQAISLKHREAPLVQSDAGDGKTFEQLVGEQSSVLSPVDGTVKKLTDDKITLKTSSGDKEVNLYNNFSLNRKSFIHNEAKVKVGDKVKKGQLLADSNYTKAGVLALGTNLKTAYVAYKGYNFDDGIVISESASERLTSEHIYKKELAVHDNVILGTEAFRSFYPNAITAKNSQKLDRDGVIKKGEKIRYGEAYLVALQKRSASKEVGLVSRVLSERPKDISLTWTLEDEGTVLDVIKTGKKFTVVIKTEERAKIGDKLAGRHGNKGVITKIIPNHEMPHTKDGNPVEVLLNPMGIISRINVSQTYESAAAKAAEKSGKTYVVKNFDGKKDYLQETKKFLDKHGVDDEEELIDPMTGKSIGKVHVGKPHLLKLFKQTQGNYSVRQGGAGHAYDANHQPVKAGGEEGAKSLDVLTMYSMLAHGARANLREMASIKSTRNDEFWKALKSGELLPPPKTSFAYDKFTHYLKGAGIDLKKNGTQMMLAPLTDHQVREMSSAEIKKPLFYRGKDMTPIKGGFFDPAKLGGFKGTKWGHMELAEAVVNPPFESAVRKLTGLGKKFDAVMEGKLHLGPNGELNTEGEGLTGGAAIEKMLKDIDTEAEMKSLLEKSKKAKGTVLDGINKKLRYLTALKIVGLKPHEAYIRRAVPVVPAQFRPVYPLPDGNVTSTDVNYIYQNAGVINTMMKLPVMDLLHEKDKSDIRKDLYEHVKGVSGLSDLNIKGKERSGFISEIKGGADGQPKEGFFISKLLSKRQDYVGRGTIIPEPSLGIDEMAMPEPMAWKLFEPFVVRELKSHGKTPLQAIEEIKYKTPLAKKALESVMEKRHVFLNRAPSLHKYSIMAFKPKITDGKSIKIQALVNKGFNADFDGDTMTIHVPITEEANAEAVKMLPSRNLFKPGTGALMIVPDQEAQIGLFYLSQTLEGRALLNKITGPEFPITQILDKKGSAELLGRLAKSMKGADYGAVVAKLKSAGEKHAFESGFSLGLKDLVTFGKERDKIVDAAKSMIAKGKNAVEVNKQVTDLTDEMLKHRLKGKGNALYDMIDSGARGSKSQLRSILVSPLFVADQRNSIVKSPISKSYAEGLDVGDYWTSLYGARKGMMDRAIQTSLPGAFSKDIMATTIDNVITAADCGTQDGVVFPLDNKEALERFTAGEQHGVPHNSLIDQNLIGNFKRKGATSVKARSPLKCHAKKGTCAHCYGLDEHNQLPEIGENIGAKAGQTVSEPLIQLVMNSFHTGGAAGTGAQTQGYARINQLLQMPKLIAGAASLATVSGKVTKLSKGLAGGYDAEITHGDKVAKVHIGTGSKPVVSVGQTVAQGDRLSEGPIKPQDLAALKGVEHAQDYITNELHNEYKTQGVGISRKTFETVVSSLTNTTKILNQPKGSTYLPGDIVAHSVVKAYNQNLSEEVATDEAEGDILTEAAGPYQPGHKVTGPEIRALMANGYKTLKVEKEAIEHKPFVKGMSMLPLLKKDWMAALGYRNLSKVLTEGASQGWQTDLENHHPVPSLAFGVNFGKGKDGKY